MAEERRIEIVPATAERWDDLVAVMEDCHASKNCWCAYWYRSQADYKAGWGKPSNRKPLEDKVRNGEEPGLVAYVNGEPAGWVSVGPRRSFDRLSRSKNFAPLDDKDVWAVNCFVVAKRFRRQGLMAEMAKAAAAFAIGKGAAGAEAYPREAGQKTGGGDLFVGTPRAMQAAGYREVARPLPARPVMRRMR